MLTLSNREIATVVWGVTLVAWALSKRDMRKALWRIVQAFKSPYITIPIALVAFYAASVVYGLYRLSFWTPELTKDTVLWFFTVALVGISSVVSHLDDSKVWRRILTDAFKILAVFEYLSSTYTFPLWVELLFVPLVTFLAMLHVVADSKVEHKQVANMILVVQYGIFVYLVIWVVGAAIADWNNLATVDTLRKLLIGPALTIALLPLLYLFRLYAIYERVFVNLNIGITKSPTVKRYARRKIFLYFGWNSKGLISFLKSNRRRGLHRVQSKADVDGIIGELSQERRGS